MKATINFLSVIVRVVNRSVVLGSLNPSAENAALLNRAKTSVLQLLLVRDSIDSMVSPAVHRLASQYDERLSDQKLNYSDRMTD